MIKFLADMYAGIFSFLCFVVLALGGLVAVNHMLEEGASDIFNILAMFVLFVLGVGFFATILDMRNCLRQLVEQNQKYTGDNGKLEDGE